jgi:hypothetical protein
VGNSSTSCACCTSSLGYHDGNNCTIAQPSVYPPQHSFIHVSNICNREVLLVYILLDHGMGIVDGRPAVVGDGCMLLHSVMYGGNGKDVGNRHPKDCVTFCLLKVAFTLRLVLLSLLVHWICKTWDTSTKLSLKKCIRKTCPEAILENLSK